MKSIISIIISDFCQSHKESNKIELCKRSVRTVCYRIHIYILKIYQCPKRTKQKSLRPTLTKSAETTLPRLHYRTRKHEHILAQFLDWNGKLDRVSFNKCSFCIHEIHVIKKRTKIREKRKEKMKYVVRCPTNYGSTNVHKMKTNNKSNDQIK